MTHETIVSLTVVSLYDISIMRIHVHGQVHCTCTCTCMLMSSEAPLHSQAELKSSGKQQYMYTHTCSLRFLMHLPLVWFDMNAQNIDTKRSR